MKNRILVALLLAVALALPAVAQQTTHYNPGSACCADRHQR